MAENYVIEMRNITKRFPGIVANDNITLTLKKGEIHALLGENGAGKSTLMSILFGLYQPDEGKILKNGQVVKINNPNDATALGIGMVHQHFKLVDVFTVLDNVILGAESEKHGFLDRKSSRAKLVELSQRYGLSVDPDMKIEDLTVGMQQRVEILKMLYRENEILIFDEPTAVLTPGEIEELLKIMKNLSAEGKSILFITHKMNEIMSVCNRCSVLCKGKYIGTVLVKDSTPESLSRMMVGRDVKFKIDKKPSKPGNVVLDIQNMFIQGKVPGKYAVNDLSMQVHSGEIVAIAGIDGNGQTEFISGITGLAKTTEGTKILLCGNDISKDSVRKRSASGISHIPEDRHKHGLVLDFSLENNIVLQRYWENDFQKDFFIKKDAVSDYSRKLIAQYDVRSSLGNKTTVREMSGGNQQKAIIAREINKKHSLLIAFQPTRGLDVGAIEYIHNQIVKDRDEGKAVLLVSYELDEVLNLADRILVMHEGRITGQLDPETATKAEIGMYMSGAKNMNEKKDGEGGKND